eukprot:m.131309 g.131309  ORF g.131309 m.131309 type:complete len:1152 (-) comp16812_c1_seq1:331-3786(-)
MGVESLLSDNGVFFTSMPLWESFFQAGLVILLAASAVTTFATTASGRGGATCDLSGLSLGIDDEDAASVKELGGYSSVVDKCCAANAPLPLSAVMFFAGLLFLLAYVLFRVSIRRDINERQDSDALYTQLRQLHKTLAALPEDWEDSAEGRQQVAHAGLDACIAVVAHVNKRNPPGWHFKLPSLHWVTIGSFFISAVLLVCLLACYVLIVSTDVKLPTHTVRKPFRTWFDHVASDCSSYHCFKCDVDDCLEADVSGLVQQGTCSGNSTRICGDTDVNCYIEKESMATFVLLTVGGFFVAIGLLLLSCRLYKALPRTARRGILRKHRFRNTANPTEIGIPWAGEKNANTALQYLKMAPADAPVDAPVVIGQQAQQGQGGAPNADPAQDAEDAYDPQDNLGQWQKWVNPASEAGSRFPRLNVSDIYHNVDELKTLQELLCESASASATTRGYAQFVEVVFGTLFVVKDIRVCIALQEALKTVQSAPVPVQALSFQPGWESMVYNEARHDYLGLENQSMSLKSLLRHVKRLNWYNDLIVRGPKGSYDVLGVVLSRVLAVPLKGVLFDGYPAVDPDSNTPESLEPALQEFARLILVSLSFPTVPLVDVDALLSVRHPFSKEPFSARRCLAVLMESIWPSVTSSPSVADLPQPKPLLPELVDSLYPKCRDRMLQAHADPTERFNAALCVMLITRLCDVQVQHSDFHIETALLAPVAARETPQAATAANRRPPPPLARAVADDASAWTVAPTLLQLQTKAFWTAPAFTRRRPMPDTARRELQALHLLRLHARNSFIHVRGVTTQTELSSLKHSVPKSVNSHVTRIILHVRTKQGVVFCLAHGLASPPTTEGPICVVVNDRGHTAHLMSGLAKYIASVVLGEIDQQPSNAMRIVKLEGLPSDLDPALVGLALCSTWLLEEKITRPAVLNSPYTAKTLTQWLRAMVRQQRAVPLVDPSTLGAQAQQPPPADPWAADRELPDNVEPLERKQVDELFDSSKRVAGQDALEAGKTGMDRLSLLLQQHAFDMLKTLHPRMMRSEDDLLANDHDDSSDARGPATLPPGDDQDGLGGARAAATAGAGHTYQGGGIAEQQVVEMTPGHSAWNVPVVTNIEMGPGPHGQERTEPQMVTYVFDEGTQHQDDAMEMTARGQHYDPETTV